MWHHGPHEAPVQNPHHHHGQTPREAEPSAILLCVETKRKTIHHAHCVPGTSQWVWSERCGWNFYVEIQVYISRNINSCWLLQSYWSSLWPTIFLSFFCSFIRSWFVFLVFFVLFFCFSFCFFFLEYWEEGHVPEGTWRSVTTPSPPRPWPQWKVKEGGSCTWGISRSRVSPVYFQDFVAQLHLPPPTTQSTGIHIENKSIKI